MSSRQEEGLGSGFGWFEEIAGRPDLDLFASLAAVVMRGGSEDADGKYYLFLGGIPVDATEQVRSLQDSHFQLQILCEAMTAQFEDADKQIQALRAQHEEDLTSAQRTIRGMVANHADEVRHLKEELRELREALDATHVPESVRWQDIESRINECMRYFYLADAERVAVSRIVLEIEQRFFSDGFPRGYTSSAVGNIARRLMQLRAELIEWCRREISVAHLTDAMVRVCDFAHSIGHGESILFASCECSCKTCRAHRRRMESME